MSEAPSGRGEMPGEAGPGRPQRPRQPPRTINANHLLNFQPSQTPSQRGGRGRGGPEGRRRAPRAARPQAYDRSKFLQANFRFMVSDAADIARYELDPDLMLDWEDIAAVDVAATAPVVCPITLGPPLVPCITPCGHIFSAEAIMAHLVAQGGPELRLSSACPVCTHDVAARELRPVTVRQADHSLRVGDRVDLVLLRRGRHSIIPHPLEAPAAEAPAAPASPPTSPPWRGAQGGGAPSQEPASRGDALHCNPYAKFTAVADPTPLWAAHAAILARKAAQLLAEGGTDAAYEVPPVLAAVDALLNRARAWAGRRQRLILDRMGEDEAAAATAAGATPEQAGRAALAAVRAAADAATAAEEAVHRRTAAAQVLEAEFPSLAVGGTRSNTGSRPEAPAAEIAAAEAEAAEMPLPEPKPEPEPAAPASDDAIYLYQSADGQPVFLCPFNIKVLVEWRGAYAALPRRLSAPVVDLEEVEQSEASRKRLRGLTHLPLGATYRLCEVDLAGAVPPEALAPFQAELAARAKKRAQQVKQEARRVQREAAAAAAAAAAEAAANSGPSLAELAAMPLPAATLRPATDPMDVPGGRVEPEEEATSSLGGGSGGGSAPGFSFARIAKMGFAATGPALGEDPGLSSPPPAGPAPVWGHSPPAVSGVWGGGGSDSGGAWGGGGGGAWGGGGGGAWGAPTGSSGQQAAPAAAPAPKGSGKGKKGKMLLLSTSQRRY